MKTSVPPAYKIEPESTVVEVSNNTNAKEQPSEPKFCCFKARNYILFLQIFKILLLTGFADSVAVCDKCHLTVTGKELLVIFFTTAALGIIGVRRRSYGIFAIYLALEMILFTRWFVTKCKEATKVPYYHYYYHDYYYDYSMDVKIPYAANLIMVSLGAIFFFFMPVIKYAWFLRATQTNSTPPSLKSKFLTVLY